MLDPIGAMPPQTSETEPGTQPEKPEKAPIQDGADPKEVAPATPQPLPSPAVSQAEEGDEAGLGLDRVAATDVAAETPKPVVDGVVGAPPAPPDEAQPSSSPTRIEPHELEAQVGEPSSVQADLSNPANTGPVAENPPGFPADNFQPSPSPAIPEVVEPEDGTDNTSNQPENANETDKPDPNRTIAEIENSLDKLKREINENSVKNVETTTGGESA